MKKLNMRWFLPLACALLVASSTFTGCMNHDNGVSVTASPSVSLNGVDLGSAIAVQNRHDDALLSIDGVVGVATGVGSDNLPTIYILTSRDNVAGLPSSLEGIHTTIRNTGIIEAGLPSTDNTLGSWGKSGSKTLAAGYTGFYRLPMPSGVSVGNDNECAAGTISCVVTDNSHYYLLSNNHVFARVNQATIGERIDQPGRYDAASIAGLQQCNQTPQAAQLSRFIPINFNRKATNVVDCAIAEVVGTPGSTTTSIAGYTPTGTVENATVGLAVEKTGRTTGQTNATIAGINGKFSVSYNHGQTAVFVNQIYINSSTFSAAGDSGSLIVDSGTLNPVALLFAGSPSSTIANPIAPVLAQLGVQIVGNGP